MESYLTAIESKLGGKTPKESYEKLCRLLENGWQPIVGLRSQIEKLIFDLENEFGFGWGRASSIVDEIIEIIKAG